LTTAIIRAMRDCPTVCDALHLPVQSGSDAVLQRMRRGYTRRRYLERVERLRAYVPSIAISTDVIVGYPGETRQEFEETLSLLDEVEFDQVFSFIYSPRPGTVAAGEEDAIQLEDKDARLHELQLRQQDIQRRRNQALLGAELEVLVDGISTRGQMRGRSRSNRVVNFEGDPSSLGKFVRIRVESAGPNSLEGRWIPASRP